MIISLPIEDRPRSYAFYQQALGLTPVGEPDEDGIPEPLQFKLAEDVTMMLIPTGGFGWVLGLPDHVHRSRRAPLDDRDLLEQAAVEGRGSSGG